MAQQKAVKGKAGIAGPPASLLDLRNILFLAGILVIVYLSFSPVLKNGFTNWDDNAYVFENETLKEPLPKATAHFFGPNYFVGNYIPLTMMVYALEYKAAGLSPGFYHAVNLCIHLANIVLVFWFIFLLSGRKPLVAALVALFFGIHPAHVESVAWIAELKDVLYCFFFLAGLICYFTYLERKKAAAPRHYLYLALCFFCFLLSLLSKPAAVIFPPVLLLLDFYTRRVHSRQVWLEKLPFFALSLLFGIIAIKAQAADQLLHDDHPLSQRFFFAAYSILSYLVKLFLPLNLANFYPYPQITDGKLPLLFYLSPLVVLGLCYLVYRSLKRSRLLVFGFLFFLVNIALVLQIISVGDAIMADRYTYVSYIGLFFVIAMGADAFYHSSEQRWKTLKPLVLILLVISGLSFSWLTHTQSKIWRNDDTIASHLVKKYPEDRLVLNNKGFILYNQKQYQEAISYFKKAIALKPDYTRASINLINVYITLNDHNSALAVAEEALKQVPADYNLLIKKGYLLSVLQRFDEGQSVLESAIAQRPTEPNAYIGLSECFYIKKDYPSGLRITEKGLKQKPQNYLLLNNRGYFLFLLGRYNEAADSYKASLAVNPAYTTASINLENCYKAMQGQGAKNH